MDKYNIIYLLLTLLCISNTSCKSDNTSTTSSKPLQENQTKKYKVPRFQADSAYALVEKQLSFGHRYPGSDGQKSMINFISSKLRSYDMKAYTQNFKIDYLGKKNIEATNIIGSFNNKASKRILLCAHWDSRLIAEKDENPSKRDSPIMGADDGASGTAVLLEIARLVHNSEIDLGIDFIFFDAEDQGENNNNESWCLGSQHWSKNPHINGYKAKFGILLDMVGAKGAKFGYEEYSMKYAPNIVRKTWKMAEAMGYGNYFQKFNAGGIMDDHYYINAYRGIPTINIINRQIEKSKHGFGHYHHTHLDNINIIDKRTLKAVGQVVTSVLFNEASNRF